MSVEKLPLRKLLQLFYAKPNKRRSILLREFGNEKRREEKESGEAQDFYGCFWADAKNHALGKLDLVEKTKERIEKNYRRKKLYNALTKGFLKLWSEKVGWRNEKFEFFPKSVRSQFVLEEVAATIRIENMVAAKIWDGSQRVIYPYFSEDPPLNGEAVRLGFWVLNNGLQDFRLDEIRIIDILRSAYFQASDFPFEGNERELLIRNYRALIAEWERIKREKKY
jgi:hypothetical protein